MWTRSTITILAGLLAAPDASGQLGSADAPVAEGVSRLRLRGSAVVVGRPVRIDDVLDFSAAEPALTAAIAAKPLFAEDGAASVTVSHEQVVQRLASLRVNLSRVLISGAASCSVTYTAPEPSEPADSAAAAPAEAPPTAGVVETGSAGTAHTLADALRERIVNELRALGKAEVEFELASREFLTLTSPPWEFAIKSRATGRLGTREFSVSLIQNGRTQRSIRVGAYVRIARRVLVARRPLSIGTLVRDGDLVAEERLFEDRADIGISDPGQIVGQQLTRFVPGGEMLRPGDVKAVDLVQRSRPVTVVGAGGGVQVSMTGIARDSGGYGDTVRIRIGEDRKSQRELRGVVTGLGTVRIAED